MKIILKIWYWFLFVLVFVIDLLDSVTFVLNEGIGWLNDSLLNYMIKLGKKIDKEDK